MKVLCVRSIRFFSFVCLLFAATPASADFIGLNAALTGINVGTGSVDLTVGFNLNEALDANGTVATNLVGVELYVQFTGLTPVLGSFELYDPAYVAGDPRRFVFDGYTFDGSTPDVSEINGTCADLGFCSPPDGDAESASHYASFVTVFAPAQPTGPGTLFTLRFSPGAASTPWSLNVFGQEGVALLWDPCDPTVDPDCFPSAEPFHFAIVEPGDNVASGTARLDVSAQFNPQVVPPAPIPEPATILLVGAGLAALARRHRRRLTAPKLY